jgi:hypothetical protein
VGANPNVIAHYYLSRLVSLLLKRDSIEAMVGCSEYYIWADVNVSSESNAPTICADPYSVIKSATRADNNFATLCFQDAEPMKENLVSNLNVRPPIENDAGSNIKSGRSAA